MNKKKYFKSFYTNDKFTNESVRDFFDQQYRYVHNLSKGEKPKC